MEVIIKVLVGLIIILKGLRVKARGGVKRNPEIKHEAKIRAESPTHK